MHAPLPLYEASPAFCGRPSGCSAGDHPRLQRATVLLFCPCCGSCAPRLAPSSRQLPRGPRACPFDPPVTVPPIPPHLDPGAWPAPALTGAGHSLTRVPHPRQAPPLRRPRASRITRPTSSGGLSPLGGRAHHCHTTRSPAHRFATTDLRRTGPAFTASSTSSPSSHPRRLHRESTCLVATGPAHTRRAVPKLRTDSSLRSGPTATYTRRLPISIPAQSGCTISRRR